MAKRTGRKFAIVQFRKGGPQWIFYGLDKRQRRRIIRRACSTRSRPT